MGKEKLVPIDLHHLWDKLLSAQRGFKQYHNTERSEEFRERGLKMAEDIVDVCIRDIEYLRDTKDIGGYTMETKV